MPCGRRAPKGEAYFSKQKTNNVYNVYNDSPLNYLLESTV
jgi:hypothetical protein